MKEILIAIISFIIGFVVCGCWFSNYYTVKDITETETGYLIEYSDNTGYYFEKGE